MPGVSRVVLLHCGSARVHGTGALFRQFVIVYLSAGASPSSTGYQRRHAMLVLQPHPCCFSDTGATAACQHAEDAFLCLWGRGGKPQRRSRSFAQLPVSLPQSSPEVPESGRGPGALCFC